MTHQLGAHGTVFWRCGRHIHVVATTSREQEAAQRRGQQAEAGAGHADKSATHDGASPAMDVGIHDRELQVGELCQLKRLLDPRSVIATHGKRHLRRCRRLWHLAMRLDGGNHVGKYRADDPKLARHAIISEEAGAGEGDDTPAVDVGGHRR